MGLTKKKRREIEERRRAKVGKRCVTCGSRFELTLHHTQDPHLSRRNPKKGQETVVLCATCHFLEDHWKMMACYENAMLKKYDKIMSEWETHWRRVDGRRNLKEQEILSHV